MVDYCEIPTVTRIILLIIVLVFSYMFIYFIPRLAAMNNCFGDIIKKFHFSCLIQVDNSVVKKCLPYIRSNNYFLINGTELDNSPKISKIDVNKQLSSCIFTSWSLTHYLLYMFVGYLFPSYFYFLIALVFGSFFEVFEHTFWGCADCLDIVWNSLGFLTGMYLNSHICG